MRRLLTRWRVVRWLPALGWMAFISYWSSQSRLPIDIPGLAFALHKSAHVGAWTILAWLNLLAVGRVPRARLLAWLLAAAFAGLDEWHQSFTPGRGAAFGDVLLDSAAAAAALWAWPILRRYASARRFRAPRGRQRARASAQP